MHLGKLGIWIAGLSAAGLAVIPPSGSNDLVIPSERDSSSRIPSKSAPAAARLSLPKRASIGEPAGDPFGLRSWAPSAPTTPEAAPATPPVAPPNPYRVAGKLIQDGFARVFLSKGDRIHEAKAGEALDGGYRVESVTNEEVVLLYVPLGTREPLPIPSTLRVEAPVAMPPGPAKPAAAANAASPVAAQAVASVPASAYLGNGGPAQLRWDGPERVRAGSSFDVALHVTSDQRLRATPMQLSFEPEVLEPLNVRAGRFFAQGNFSYRVNPGGSIFVGASGIGASPGADAELLVVTFRPMKAGATAEVKLSSLALQGTAGRTLDHHKVSTFRTAIQ